MTNLPLSITYSIFYETFLSTRSRHISGEEHSINNVKDMAEFIKHLITIDAADFDYANIENMTIYFGESDDTSKSTKKYEITGCQTISGREITDAIITVYTNSKGDVTYLAERLNEMARNGLLYDYCHNKYQSVKACETKKG